MNLDSLKGGICEATLLGRCQIRTFADMLQPSKSFMNNRIRGTLCQVVMKSRPSFRCRDMQPKCERKVVRQQFFGLSDRGPQGPWSYESKLRLILLHSKTKDRIFRFSSFLACIIVVLLAIKPAIVQGIFFNMTMLPIKLKVLFTFLLGHQSLKSLILPTK